MWLPVFVVALCGTVALLPDNLKSRRLPNPVTLATSVAVVAALLVVGLVEGDLTVVLRGLLAGAAAFSVLFAVVFAFPAQGPGLGTAKAAVPIGIAAGVVGWLAVAIAGLAFVVSGLLTGLILFALRRRDPVPTGPFLLVALLSVPVSALLV